MEQKRKISWAALIVFIASLIGVSIISTTTFTPSINARRANEQLGNKIIGEEFPEFVFGQSGNHELIYVLNRDVQGTWTVTSTAADYITIDATGKVTILSTIPVGSYDYVVNFSFAGSVVADLHCSLTIHPLGYASIFGPYAWSIPWRYENYQNAFYSIADEVTKDGRWSVISNVNSLINIDPYSGELILNRNLLTPAVYDYKVIYSSSETEEIAYQCSLEVTRAELEIYPKTAAANLSKKYNTITNVPFTPSVAGGNWSVNSNTNKITINDQGVLNFPKDLPIGTYNYEVSYNINNIDPNYETAKYAGTFSVINGDFAIENIDVVDHSYAYNSNFSYQYRLASTPSTTTWSIDSSSIQIDQTGKIYTSATLPVGVYPYTITITNPNFNQQQISGSVTVNKATIAIKNSTTLTKTFGDAYSYQFTTNIVGSNTTWAINNSNFTIDNTGKISAPYNLNSGRHDFQITVKNPNYNDFFTPASLTVEKGYAKLSKGASYTYAYDSGVKTNVLETAALGSTSFVLVSTSHSGITFNQANHTVSFDPFIPVGTHKYQVKLINSNYYDSVVECSVTITKGTMKVIDLTDWDRQLAVAYEPVIDSSGRYPTITLAFKSYFAATQKTFKTSAHGVSTFSLLNNFHNLFSITDSHSGTVYQAQSETSSNPLGPYTEGFALRIKCTNPNYFDLQFSVTFYYR